MLPTSTNVTVKVASKAPAGAHLAILVAAKPQAGAAPLTEPAHKAFAQLIDAGAFKGKAAEVADALFGDGKSALHLLAAGVGEAANATAESLRQAAGAIARAARKRSLKSVAVFLPSLDKVSPADAAGAIVTGLLLASFKYIEYRGTAQKEKAEKDSEAPIAFTLVTAEPAAVAAAKHAMVVADAQNFARTIAHRPGNDINPVTLAKLVQGVAREVGLGIEILDEKQMAKMSMGGMLGVGGGSANQPRMIALKHSAGPKNRKKGTLLLVGKTITFDTGGISIKPAAQMQRMIFDKCGGMAVLGAMCAIAKLNPAIDVVGILAAAENHVSDRAYRPGDILRMHNGVTVEVTNTDAEGRLVLGDALAWGIEKFKPAAVVDLATLTGGVVVAIGKSMAGVMANNDALFGEFSAASAATSEKIWRLPVDEEHREMMKSDWADILNSGPREAHPLQGGAFLSYFVPKQTPWAHFDIAGCADTERELPYYIKGATGWGVRTLVNWVESRAAGK